MEKIDVKEFKGLYTNLLDNSANYSVFSDMDKVNVSKKYLQSEEYKLEDSLGWIGEFGNDVIEVKVVELDDDKFWYEKNLEKYIPDFVKHLVVFTSTTVLVYEIKTEGLVYIDAFSISEYKKSVIVNGILKILTSKSIHFLFYKRINSVKTLKFTSINPTIDSLVASSSTGNVTLTDPKITFDIVATPMIYWLSDTMQGTNIRTSLYKLPSDWDVKDAITNVWFYAYIGTVYLVRPKHNTLNLQTKGLYDFDSLAGNTFAFVPVEILNGAVCLIPTRVNYTEIVKKPVFYNLNGSTYFDARNRVYNPDVTLGFPTEIRVNPETAFFIGADELHIGNFNAKFIFEVLPTNPYVTVASGRTAILQSKFFEWFNNPDYEHKIRGTYTLTVTDLGFEVTSENQQIVGNFIQTVTYIDNDEVIIAKAQVFATSSSTRVIYGLKPIRIFDSAVIQSKIYIGFGIKPSVYELVSSKQIYKGEVFDEINYYGYLDLTGILLSNLLAVYGDIDQFEYVKGGDDYVIVNNVGFLIKGGTVYYSPNDVSNAVFYKNRYIPNVYGDALISIGGMLGVIRYNKDVTLISLQVIENEIYFKVYDTIGFIIQGRNQVLEIPDGVLMSLRDGLYLSTPQERQLLSEPINDIFKQGTLPKILYDDYNRRIMLQKDTTVGTVTTSDTYVFDLIEKLWIKFKNFNLNNIAFDGDDIITIQDSNFYKVILSTTNAEGYLKFHPSNLGSEKIVKTLVGLRIDIEGTLTMVSNSSCLYEPPTSLKSEDRRIEEFYFLMSDQLPTVNMGFELKFKGKIYSMEILYNLAGEFPKSFIGV